MAAVWRMARSRKGDFLESCGTVASEATLTNGKNDAFFRYLDNSRSASLSVIFRGSKRLEVCSVFVGGTESESPRNSACRAWSSSTLPLASGAAMDGRLSAKLSLKMGAWLLSGLDTVFLFWRNVRGCTCSLHAWIAVLRWAYNSWKGPTHYAFS